MGAPPERIGRYRLREVIGTGGFATVYRATDERFRTDVALKVLAENHSFDPSVRERFIEEGRRLRSLSSTHLISVYDMGETDRAQPYLVLDWAERGDLARRVTEARARGWSPRWSDVASVAHALASGLADLHAHQLVHRDLAPKNVLLRPTLSPRIGGLPDEELGVHGAPAPPGPPAQDLTSPPLPGSGTAELPELVCHDEQLVLADLGMSKDLAAASGLTLAAGTSGFAPPEQREPGLAVDARADLWAASALIIWLLTGQAPDDAGRWKAAVPSAGWPPALVDALARGLADQPCDRHPTIEAWHESIRAALPRHAHGLALPSVAAPAPPPAPTDYGYREPTSNLPVPAPRTLPDSRPRFRPATVALLVPGALLVGLIGGFIVGRDAPSSPTATIEELEDDRLRTTVEDDGVTIVLEGPTRAVVEETTILTATVEGSEDWTWVGPDGVMQSGPTLELAPRTPGRGTVHLLASTDDGTLLTVTHDLAIVGDDE